MEINAYFDDLSRRLALTAVFEAPPLTPVEDRHTVITLASGKRYKISVNEITDEEQPAG